MLRSAGVIVLFVLAVFAFIFNFASGFFYTWLKFDVFAHTQGTGVVPGPWLIVPFLAIAVIPIGFVVGLVFFAGWKLLGRSGGFLASMLAGFLAASIVFHILVINSIVLDADYYAAVFGG